MIELLLNNGIEMLWGESEVALFQTLNGHLLGRTEENSQKGINQDSLPG